MRMKLANLVRLGEVAPERTTVYTWNADENEHMLAINIALGFEPHGMSAEFAARAGDAATRQADAGDAACGAAGTSGTGATSGS